MAHDPYADFPTLGLTPWYTEIVAWATSVETAVDQVEDEEQAHIANADAHVPAGGSTGQALVKLSAADGDTAWATISSGGVTDHGALTGLNDADHAISAVINLQTTLDGKSAVGHTHSYEAVGVAAGLVNAHAAAADPHSQYMTQAEGSALFAPLARGIPAGGTTGQVLAKSSGTDYAVAWVAAGGSFTAPASIVGTDPATIPLLVKAAAAQTAAIFSTQLSDGTLVLNVSSLGEARVGAGAPNINGTLKVGNTDPTRKGIVVRMAAAQSASGWELQANDGTVLASYSAAGLLAAPNVDRRVSVLSATADPSALPDNTVILRRP